MKAPKSATTGAASAMILGGALGWKAGVDLFLAPGQIVAALAGVSAVRALGGVTGALVGAGISEYKAERFEGRIKHGGILLSIHRDNEEWVKRAKQVLSRTGAEDVASSIQAAADYEASDKPMPRTRGTIGLL